MLARGGGARVQAGSIAASRSPTRSIWARDMVNEPSAAKSPAAFADAAKKLLRGKGVTVKVLGVPEMTKEALGGVLGVGQGSNQPPRFVKVTYNASGRAGFARARRQGRGVRLRWPVDQVGRRHGGDEDRHGRRRRGARRDVDAQGPRREGEGHRLRPDGREHAERHRDPARATC